MSEAAIKVENVTKIYPIWKRAHARLGGMMAQRWRHAQWLPGFFRRWLDNYYKSVCREFAAVRNISFEVSRGQTVGIIGRNGSGKSTTLKMIAGTLQPTQGRITVKGRVAALLELGSGFNPEFTGRENVFLAAAILGLNRAQTEAKFAEILDFADIGEFINQPVKTYSSGMMLRLAFAVHTAVEPEILIIDEALAVGDEGFRRKCFARLERLREEGTTILFVSHDMGSILNLTSQALFFHQGEIIVRGGPKAVVRGYNQFAHAKPGQEEVVLNRLRMEKVVGSVRPSADEDAEEAAARELERSREGLPEDYLPGEEDDAPVIVAEDGYEPLLQSKSVFAYDAHGARITNARILTLDGEVVNRLVRGRRYRYCYTVEYEEAGNKVSYAMLIKTYKGVELGGARSLPINQYHERVEAGETVEVEFIFDCLLTPGVYFLNAGVEGDLGEKRSYLHRVVDAAVFRVCHESGLKPTGIIDFQIETTVTHREPAAR
jgi:lipopolysaccharide transport system ATP-binding protein